MQRRKSARTIFGHCRLAANCVSDRSRCRPAARRTLRRYDRPAPDRRFFQ
jgi:hypothetical protein